MCLADEQDPYHGISNDRENLMAATVTWNGFGNVSTADSTTGWGVIKITSGGGTPTVNTADGQIEGTGAVTITSNAKRVALYYDLGSGNELDFSGGGTEEGEMIYVWAQFLAAGLLQTQATGGFGIFLESSTPSATQYHIWYFYGSDNYSGGWKRLVLDPTETVSASAGTGINLASVRYIGVFADTTGTARFDNLVCDAIDVGTGLTVMGTSTVEALIADLLSDEATNRYGIVTALNDSETAVELAGSLVLGDVTAATNSTLSDVDAKIFLAEPLYHDGTSITNSVPLDYFGITCVGGTGTNSIIIGKAVGTDAGRSGWSIVGNVTYDFSLDFDDGNVNTSEWYGCSFETLSGLLTWGTNTAHKLFSSSFSGCEQFDPIGGVQIRNCSFTAMYDDGTADATNNASLLWNDSIDIEKSNFLANSHTGSDVAHGIEHTSTTGDAIGTVTTADATGITLHDTAASFLTTVAVNDVVFNETDGSSATVTSVTSNIALICDGLLGGTDDQWDTSDAYSIVTPITYTDLQFSGNEIDVHNNKAGTNGLAISKSGTSDPSTSTGEVKFISSVPLKWTVIDKDANAVSGAQVSAFLKSDDSPIMTPTDTNGSGVVSTSYAQATPVDIYYRVRKSSIGSTKYILFSAFGTISTSGLDVTVTLQEDTNNNT